MEDTLPITCPECSATNPDGYEFCASCGRELLLASAPQPRQNSDGAGQQAASVAPPPGAWSLVPVQQGHLLEDRAIPLRGPRLVLGRFDADTGPVDVELGDLPAGESTSRRHALLEYAGDGWRVSDAGSTNGVFVRRRGQDRFSARVVDAVTVGDGDEIGLGMLICLLRGPGAPTSQPQSAANEAAAVPTPAAPALVPQPPDQPGLPPAADNAAAKEAEGPADDEADAGTEWSVEI